MGKINYTVNRTPPFCSLSPITHFHTCCCTRGWLSWRLRTSSVPPTRRGAAGAGQEERGQPGGRTSRHRASQAASLFKLESGGGKFSGSGTSLLSSSRRRTPAASRRLFSLQFIKEARSRSPARRPQSVRLCVSRSLPCQTQCPTPWR